MLLRAILLIECWLKGSLECLRPVKLRRNGVRSDYDTQVMSILIHKNRLFGPLEFSSLKVKGGRVFVFVA